MFVMKPKKAIWVYIHQMMFIMEFNSYYSGGVIFLNKYIQGVNFVNAHV